jgi:hypothetical protein
VPVPSLFCIRELPKAADPDDLHGHNRASERVWSVPVLVTVAECGRCFAFVTRPDEGPYVPWTYRLEPSGAGTRVTEVWDVEQLPPALQSAPQDQLNERSRYTEAMLATPLAVIKATAEGWAEACMPGACRLAKNKTCPHSEVAFFRRK